MTIPVEHEPDDCPTKTLEHCCFCGRKTPYWHAPKDVAVCLKCAEVMEPDDVPTKAEWCASPQAKGYPPI